LFTTKSKFIIFLISISIPSSELLRRSVDAYSSEAAKLACRLLEFMAKGAGADPATLRRVFEGQAQGMRVNYYPPCRQAADRVVGLTAHTDPNGLTLLLQMSDDDVQGLQVKKDGRWFAVQALAGAIIVNVGDALEVVLAYCIRSFRPSPEIPRSADMLMVI
jgi:isopenicillin N synthase-like dioxygenase